MKFLIFQLKLFSGKISSRSSRNHKLQCLRKIFFIILKPIKCLRASSSVSNKIINMKTTINYNKEPIKYKNYFYSYLRVVYKRLKLQQFNKNLQLVQVILMKYCAKRLNCIINEYTQINRIINFLESYMVKNFRVGQNYREAENGR